MTNARAHLSTAPLVTMEVEGQKAAVQVIGVPFDGTSTYRTGSRFGPDAVRAAFWNVEVYLPHLGLDLETIALDDLGNIQHSASVTQTVAWVEETVRASSVAGCVPATLGGEHSISYGAIRAFDGPLTLLVFDAHFDLRDEYDDLSLMHATYLRRLMEEKPDLKVIHVGVRGASRDEWAFARERGVTAITADEVAAEGSSGLNARLREALEGTERLYITIDLDGLDPAYAPGVSNPEPAGLTSRQVLDALRLLRGTPIVGFDIVELCPQYDLGGITAVVAARYLAELCGLVTVQRAPRG